MNIIFFIFYLPTQGIYFLAILKVKYHKDILNEPYNSFVGYFPKNLLSV